MIRSLSIAYSLVFLQKVCGLLYRGPQAGHGHPSDVTVHRFLLPLRFLAETLPPRAGLVLNASSEFPFSQPL